MCRHYPGLFEDDPRWQARARRLGRRTFEFSEYLIELVMVHGAHGPRALYLVIVDDDG